MSQEKKMTEDDLTITRLCAEAMGVDFSKGFGTITCKECGEIGIPYDPIHDDAQAMALVKKFHLGLAWSGYWSAYEQGNGASGSNASINHAICEAVAKMQNAKSLP